MISSRITEKPFIVAEMSGNHNQSLDCALALVDAAADAGADAIKLQTYTADTMTFQEVYRIEDPSSPWSGQDLYQLYQRAFTPQEWHAPIYERAKQRGIIAFSSPFDEDAVDFLQSLDTPIFKIASFENTHIPLLRKVAQTKKPVILSTGVSTLAQIDEAVTTLRQHGCEELVLLKCTSTYPAPAHAANLATLPHMKSAFHNCIVGISDHTLGMGVALAAIGLGAQVIEKHLVLSREQGAVDACFSLEPHELGQLVQEAKMAYMAIGKISYGIHETERENLVFKRSVITVKKIRKGEMFTVDNIKTLRPALGIEPKYYDLILNKEAKMEMQPGMPVQWEHVL